MHSSLLRNAANLLARYGRTTSCVKLCQSVNPHLGHQRHAFSTTFSLQAKNKSKAKSSAPSPSEDSASTSTILDSALADAEAAVEVVMKKLNEQIKHLKAGRQNPSRLKNLKIPGEDTILSTLAAVTQKNPKTFLVTVYDPAHVKQISSVIASSGQNFNPQPVPNNPTQLTINIPSESALAIGQKVKQLNEHGLKAKDAVRHARGNGIRAIRASKATNDQMSVVEKKVHALSSTSTSGIDKLVDDTRKAMI